MKDLKTIRLRGENNMYGTVLVHRDHKYIKKEMRNGRWRYWYDYSKNKLSNTFKKTNSSNQHQNPNVAIEEQKIYPQFIKEEKIKEQKIYPQFIKEDKIEEQKIYETEVKEIRKEEHKSAESFIDQKKHLKLH